MIRYYVMYSHKIVSIFGVQIENVLKRICLNFQNIPAICQTVYNALLLHVYFMKICKFFNKLISYICLYYTD